MAVKKSVVKKTKVTTSKPGKKVASKSSKSNVVKIKPVKSKTKPTKAVEKKSTAKSIGKITKPLTKSELYKTIADSAELSRNQVTAVFDTLAEVIGLHLKKDGPEKFILPGMLKILVKKIPAKPERKGVNPFTKEPTIFKAKPASKKVKIIALHGLKNKC